VVKEVGKAADSDSDDVLPADVIVFVARIEDSFTGTDAVTACVVTPGRRRALILGLCMVLGPMVDSLAFPLLPQQTQDKNPGLHAIANFVTYFLHFWHLLVRSQNDEALYFYEFWGLCLIKFMK